MIQERAAGPGHGLPQAAGVRTADRTCGPERFHVAGEHGQGFAEGQVGVADTGLGVAASGDSQQVGVGLHSPGGEGPQERRLAPSGAAGEEDHLALTAQRLLEVAIQSRQLPLAGDKDRAFWFRRLFGGKEPRKRCRDLYRAAAGQGLANATARNRGDPPTHLPIADALVQLPRLRPRLDTQILG